jgi:hypothetical protein
MTEYVKVPKHLLEQLEEDRKSLYDVLEKYDVLGKMGEENIYLKTLFIADFGDVTGSIWELANRKWEVVND